MQLRKIGLCQVEFARGGAGVRCIPKLLVTERGVYARLRRFNSSTPPRHRMSGRFSHPDAEAGWSPRSHQHQQHGDAREAGRPELFERAILTIDSTPGVREF